MNWLRWMTGSLQQARSCLACRLIVEELEPRTLLATLTPIQTRHAYGFDQVSFSVDGQTVRGDGSGQTIAIVVAYDQPRLLEDLDAFSQYFTLGGSQTLYQEYGPASSYLTVARPQGQPAQDTKGMWALETSLDVQWAHAIAPGAKILLVQAKTSSFTHLMQAVAYARRQEGVSVISMSWGSAEFRYSGRYNSRFTTPGDHQGGSDGRGGPLLAGGITYVAASGDSGRPGLWPGVSRNVVAVGGTTLTTDAYGNYQGEEAWRKSGGGVSVYQRKPAYQSALSAQRRAGPDVAYNGDPGSGFYVYHTLPINGHASTWWSVGGTSAGAPQWAALFAIANQGRALAGLGSLDGRGQTLPALYQMPSDNFNDIVNGFNGGHAKPGFDLVTGHGTPRGAAVIADLVSYVSGAIAPATAGPLAAGAAPPIGPASLHFSLLDQGSLGWNVDHLRRPETDGDRIETRRRPVKLPQWLQSLASARPEAREPRATETVWDENAEDVTDCFTTAGWMGLPLPGQRG